MGRHLKMNSLEKAFYKVDRERKLVEQKGRCVYCGTPLTRRTATMDHVVPVSRTGRLHSPLNAVVACKTCNGEKADRDDFRAVPAPLHDDPLVAAMFARIETRVRLCEWKLSFDAKGSFRKWMKFHEKRGRWLTTRRKG